MDLAQGAGQCRHTAVRSCGQDTAENREGLVPLAVFEQQDTQIEGKLELGRVVPHGKPVVLDGLHPVLSVVGDIPQPGAGIPEQNTVGRKIEDPFEFRPGRGGTPLAEQGHAQFVADAGIITPCQRQGVGRRRLTVPPQCKLGLPQMEAAPDRLRIVVQRILEMPERCLVVTFQLGDQPQPVQGRNIAGIGLQGFPEDHRRLCPLLPGEIEIAEIVAGLEPLGLAQLLFLDELPQEADRLAVIPLPVCLHGRGKRGTGMDPGLPGQDTVVIRNGKTLPAVGPLMQQKKQQERQGEERHGDGRQDRSLAVEKAGSDGAGKALHRSRIADGISDNRIKHPVYEFVRVRIANRFASETASVIDTS